MAWLRAVSLCWVLAVSGPVGAQTLKDAPTTADMEADAAIGHFRLGVEFYRLGNYDAARVEFEAAYGLSRMTDLLHNLSMTAEKQGQLGAAIDFEERFLAGKRGELTADETDQARGRLLRLREIQSGKAPARMVGTPPGTSPAAQTDGGAQQAAQAAPAAHSTQAGHGAGGRPPGAAMGLMVGGGAALVAGIVCGSLALSTGAQLGGGQAFTLRDIDTLKRQGEGLNVAAITLDIAGGVALAGGVVWTIADRLRPRHAERSPRPLVASIARGW